jgi:hypothetical protein
MPYFPILRRNKGVNTPAKLARQVRAAKNRKIPGADDRTVTFALSSKEPCRQRFGNEILRHGKDNIRADRLTSGMVPLLFNQDPDRHLEVVDFYEIKDGALRVTTSRKNFIDIFGRFLVVQFEYGAILRELMDCGRKVIVL